jgi:protein SCO1/2
MKQFLAGFDPSFIGLSGTPEELQPVWVEFGARITRDFTGGTVDGGYAVEHPTTLFVVDQEGRLAMKIPYLRRTADAANDLRTLLQ